MNTLDRKLLRDLTLIKSQVLTIALVVAAGIGAFISQISTYTSLQATRHEYYAQARFADLFADVKRAPNAIGRQLAELAGVAEADTTVTFDVTLDLPGVAEPVIGRMIGLAGARQPPLNRLSLRQGRLLERGDAAVLVSEGFAKARQLKPGDTVVAILNGKRETLPIAGIVLSPEYVFATRGGGLPDDSSFGVFWMERDRLASAFNMEGAFNHAVVRMAPGASEASLRDAIDRLLASYGGRGAHGRDEQLSHKMLSQEINQQRTMSTIFPTIFLGVAAFLVNVVLSRQVATQRGEIAALKALGYDDAVIAGHYLKLVLAIVLLGIVLGLALGAWFGHFMTNMYTEFFHFPRLGYRIDAWIPLTAAGISALAALAGGFGTLHAIMQLAPAEAMRPPAPAQFRPLLLERAGLARLLSPQARMIARTLERRPWRAALTTFGIASSVAVIVAGTFWQDAIDYMVAVQFYTADRADLQVGFAEPVAGRARHEVARLPGVLSSEAGRTVPVRLRAQQRSYLTSITGLPADAHLRRLLDRRQGQLAVPPDGLLLTDRLAERLGVKPGDIVQLDILEGRRAVREIVLAGVVHELFGLSAYMDIGALRRLLGEGDTVSSIGIASGGPPDTALLARLKAMPKVATVSIKAAALRTFEQTSARNLLVFTTIVTLLAVAISVGVVYNSARISLAERAWELASLRVLGFTRGEVSALLLGELAVLLLAAIPFGLWLGYLLSWLIIRFTHTETFSIPLVILPPTYAYAALATLLAGVASALIVRNRIDRLDLVAVLKTRE